MDKTSKKVSDLGRLYSLSPEYWLSTSSAELLQDGISLNDVVVLQKTTTTKIPDSALVLDTGNSDRGLLHIPKPTLLQPAKRVSTKKQVPPGAVLISRLRPYLQQVSYIPEDVKPLLGYSEVLCSTEYYVLTSKNEDSIAYLVPWLLTQEVQSVFQQATTGGHHPRFNDDLLMRLSIPKRIYDRRGEISQRVDEAVHQHIDAQLRQEDIISLVNQD